VQDVTEQQLSSVNHLIETVRDRIDALLARLGTGQADRSDAPSGEPSRTAAFNMNAEYDRSGDQQRMADNVMAGKDGGTSTGGRGGGGTGGTASQSTASNGASSNGASANGASSDGGEAASQSDIDDMFDDGGGGSGGGDEGGAGRNRRAFSVGPAPDAPRAAPGSSQGAQVASGPMSEQHPIHDDGMQEIVESFVVEATEIYDGLEGDLLQLEKTPEDEELVDSVFRDVHTVKGTAGFLDLEQLSTLAHRFEEVLDAMREQEVDFEPAMTDVMLCAFDHMKVLTQQVIDRDLEPLEMEPLLDALEAINEGTFEAGAVSLPDPDGGAPEEVGGDAAGGADEPTDADGTGDTEGAASPDAGEPSDDTSSTDGDGGDGDSGRKAPDTIRVEVSRLNQLMDLVGELVLGRNRLLQLITEARTEHDARADTDERLRLDSLLGELEEASDKVDYTTTELQSAIMQTRMVEVGQVFGKFPRVVRDLAREFDKQIDLTVEGEDTELDKSLVEEIGDPLLHLVRNAADHGIEPPEERKEKGKDPRGEIHLSASHAGNHIIIEIADDGAGLDPDALRRKAIEKDVLTEDEATDLSDSEAYQLIFRPGFSTTEEVGQVSGRGVGMDVVKTNLAELNGTIDIDSTPGEGTRFTLKLPLTLAILQSMLVRSGAETFAIPLYAVSEAVRLEPGMIETIQEGEVIEHRDQVIPVMRLGEVLDVQSPDAGGQRADRFTEEQDAYAVVVNVAHRRAALVVDELISQEEVVIKSLGDYLKSVPGIAGSTILGDGQVIMVLDIGEMIQHEEFAAEEEGAEAADADGVPAASSK
jgi:two-component system chemotaxis sensor kinase CheA